MAPEERLETHLYLVATDCLRRVVTTTALGFGQRTQISRRFTISAVGHFHILGVSFGANRVDGGFEPDTNHRR